MRNNKLGGRKYFTQTITIAEKRKNGTPNPDAGKQRTIIHRITPKP